MVKKYLFDLYHFDQPATPAPPPEAAPPVYTQADLQAAQDEAFRRGKQEGFRESEEGISREIATFLGILNTQLDDLLRAEGARNDNFAKDVITALQSLYAQTCPALIKAESWPLTLTMVQEVIGSLPKQQAMTITIPELYRETLTQYLETMYSDSATRFQVEVEPLLPLGDCRIAWTNGGAIQSLATLQAQILDKMQHLLADMDATAHHISAPSPQRMDDKDIDDE